MYKKRLLVDTIHIIGGNFFMKSFAIKSNNNQINKYLLNSFENYNLENFHISYKKFKIYNNIILHYKNKNTTEFYDCFCEILTNCIIKYYEESILKQLITLNYFYFSKIEQSMILKNCLSYLKDINNLENMTRRENIYISLLKYIDENKSFILDGFVNFRLENYKKVLEYVVDLNVNNFLIEKEYNEFVSLLKIYINSKSSECNCLHLLYKNDSAVLLDENYNQIDTKNYLLDAKYLSDISFSENDFILNALLTLLPKKLYIHLLSKSDEFIETLKLIFTNRISLCKHCSLCTKYKYLNKIK